MYRGGVDRGHVSPDDSFIRRSCARRTRQRGIPKIQTLRAVDDPSGWLRVADGEVPPKGYGPWPLFAILLHEETTMHGANAKDTRKLFPDYKDLVDRDDVKALAATAKDLGLTFKIGGFPFGADPETHRKTLGLDPVS